MHLISGRSNRFSLLGAIVIAVVAVTGILVKQTSHAAALSADLNHDGRVDVLDLSQLLANWGKTNTMTDLNADGRTDVLDLSLLLSAWGSTSTPVATASPAPTIVAPSPTVAPTPPLATKNCAASPHLCGYPDATNTGVPSGTALTSSGTISVTTAGTIIDARNVTGVINVQANNVVVKRTRVTSGDYYPIRQFPGFTGLVVQDSEVVGQGCSEAITGSDYTAIRDNFHGCEDGLEADDHVTMRDSYIHDLYTSPTGHNDGVQGLGGTAIVLDHNSIIWRALETSAINYTSYFSPISNVKITNNLIGGGNYSIYVRKDTGTGFGAPTNVLITGNRFIRTFVYGLISADGAVSASGNVYDDTGLPAAL